MVLIVDDDEGFRHGLAEHLREDGHSVREYGSPAELPSLDTLSGTTLLITDYHMPGEDGLRLAERFHHANPQVPVIIVTAHWGQHLDAVAKKLDYLSLCQKPLDYFSFHELVHRISDGKKTG